MAGAPLVFAICMTCFRWLQYPHVNLTIFNETSSAVCDVRVGFLYGEGKQLVSVHIVEGNSN